MGDLERPGRSILSPGSVSAGGSKLSGRSDAGVKPRDKLLSCATGSRDDVGVFAGEDFVGEIDLARSEFMVS